MITFKFNEKKTTQAAAFLIKEAGGSMNYTKLIKLLYLADREAIGGWERSITGDSFVSMKLGPVLSNTYDLINYPGDSYWYKYIQKSNYDVCLSTEPETTLLTKNEIEVLMEIHNKFKDKDWKEMIYFCHDYCEEWRHPGESAITIYVEDILRALKRTEREIEIIEDEVSVINYARDIF